MQSLYTLIIDIASTIEDEEKFRSLIAPRLNCLDALKGAFDRKPSNITYYPPNAQHGKHDGWSARCVVMISVGKKRAEHLYQLYQAIARLIMLELADLEVRCQTGELQLSAPWPFDFPPTYFV
jgi:hypothetical protein